jgi:hypothetical protein
LRKTVGQKFQGDVAAEPGVFGFLNHAHAAIGELLHQEEMRKRFWYVHCSRLFNYLVRTENGAARKFY